MTNADSQNVHTRQSYNFHLSLTSVTIYQQIVHYSGMKCFNKPLLEIKKKNAWNWNTFKQALRKFPNTQSFYTWRNCAILNVCAYSKENLTIIILKVCWYLETEHYFKLF